MKENREQKKRGRHCGVKRKGAALLLGCLMLAGCGHTVSQKGAASFQEDAREQETVITILMPGESDPEACEQVSQQLSEYTQEQWGFSVEIIQEARESYNTVLWQQIKSNDAPDLFYLPAEQALGLPIYQDTLSPLSSLLKAHEGLYQAFSERQWDCRQYYRIIYAVPARTSECYQVCFWARTDLMENLGVNPDEIQTLDQLHQVLQLVKYTYPDVTPVVSNYSTTISTWTQDPLNDNLGVLMDHQGTTVVNWYASDEYQDLCRTMYQWAQENLILKDACIRNEAGENLLVACNGFGFFSQYSVGSPLIRTTSAGTSLTAIRLSPVLQNSSGMADSWALPVNGSHKSQVLNLLEWLYTDGEAARLFLYGGEEIEGSDEQAFKGRWENSCISIQDPPESQEICVSPAYGFVYNEMDMLTKISACQALVEQYDGALMCGYLNPDEALPRFLKELEDAGIQEIVGAKQRQLDDWLQARR